MIDIQDLATEMKKLGGGINIKQQYIQTILIKNGKSKINEKKFSIVLEDFQQFSQIYQSDIIPQFLQFFNQNILIFGQNSMQNIENLGQILLQNLNQKQMICISFYMIGIQNKKQKIFDLLDQAKQKELKAIIDCEINSIDDLMFYQEYAVKQMSQDLELESLIVRFSLIENSKKKSELNIFSLLHQNFDNELYDILQNITKEVKKQKGLQKIKSSSQNLIINILTKTLFNDSQSYIVANLQSENIQEQIEQVLNFNEIQTISTKSSQQQQLFVNFYSFDDFKENINQQIDFVINKQNEKRNILQPKQVQAKQKLKQDNYYQNNFEKQVTFDENTNLESPKPKFIQKKNKKIQDQKINEINTDEDQFEELKQQNQKYRQKLNILIKQNNLQSFIDLFDQEIEQLNREIYNLRQFRYEIAENDSNVHFKKIINKMNEELLSKNETISKFQIQLREKEIKKAQKENPQTHIYQKQKYQEDGKSKNDEIIYLNNIIKSLNQENQELNQKIIDLDSLLNLNKSNFDNISQKQFQLYDQHFKDLELILQELNPNLKFATVQKFQRNLSLIKQLFQSQYDSLQVQKQSQNKYIEFMTNLQVDLEKDYGKFEPVVKKTNNQIRQFLFNKIIQD